VLALEGCHICGLPQLALPQLPPAQFAGRVVVARHVVTFEASHAYGLAQAFALTIWIERGRIHAHERRVCINAQRCHAHTRHDERRVTDESKQFFLSRSRVERYTSIEAESG
jgi:hypothetical protein